MGLKKLAEFLTRYKVIPMILLNFNVPPFLGTVGVCVKWVEQIQLALFKESLMKKQAKPEIN